MATEAAQAAVASAMTPTVPETDYRTRARIRQAQIQSFQHSLISAQNYHILLNYRYSPDDIFDAWLYTGPDWNVAARLIGDAQGGPSEFRLTQGQAAQ